ncbi:MAG: DUF4157 domain-containing protein [Planctomycetaceae bacterium]
MSDCMSKGHSQQTGHERTAAAVTGGGLQRTPGGRPNSLMASMLQWQRRAGNRATGEWLRSLSQVGTAEAEMVALGTRGGGQPLDGPTRATMESRLGHDFSGVRIHTDASAALAAKALGARAFTVGKDIVFSGSRYSPATPSGQRLLGHELAHVVQQSRGGGQAAAGATASEAEARSAGDAVASGGAAAITTAVAPGVQKATEEEEQKQQSLAEIQSKIPSSSQSETCTSIASATSPGPQGVWDENAKMCRTEEASNASFGVERRETQKIADNQSLTQNSSPKFSAEASETELNSGLAKVTDSSLSVRSEMVGENVSQFSEIASPAPGTPTADATVGSNLAEGETQTSKTGNGTDQPRQPQDFWKDAAAAFVQQTLWGIYGDLAAGSPFLPGRNRLEAFRKAEGVLDGVKAIFNSSEDVQAVEKANKLLGPYASKAEKYKFAMNYRFNPLFRSAITVLEDRGTDLKKTDLALMTVNELNPLYNAAIAAIESKDAYDAEDPQKFGENAADAVKGVVDTIKIVLEPIVLEQSVINATSKLKNPKPPADAFHHQGGNNRMQPRGKPPQPSASLGRQSGGNVPKSPVEEPMVHNGDTSPGNARAKSAPTPVETAGPESGVQPRGNLAHPEIVDTELHPATANARVANDNAVPPSEPQLQKLPATGTDDFHPNAAERDSQVPASTSKAAPVTKDAGDGFSNSKPKAASTTKNGRSGQPNESNASANDSEARAQRRGGKVSRPSSSTASEAVGMEFPMRTLRGKTLQWLSRNKPKGWTKTPTRNNEGFIWKDLNGTERLRFMRPKGENASKLQWSRQEVGYFRWCNEAGEFMDIAGNVIKKSDPEYEFKTHIAYTGPL